MFQPFVATCPASPNASGSLWPAVIGVTGTLLGVIVGAWLQKRTHANALATELWKQRVASYSRLSFLLLSSQSPVRTLIRRERNEPLGPEMEQWAANRLLRCLRVLSYANLRTALCVEDDVYRSTSEAGQLLVEIWQHHEEGKEVTEEQYNAYTHATAKAIKVMAAQLNVDLLDRVIERMIHDAGRVLPKANDNVGPSS